MANNDWLRRDACPACAGAASDVWSCAYADEPLRSTLDRAYAKVGRIDHARLAGAIYALRRCSTCGTAFQRDAPDGALAEELYEHWIDPVAAAARHAAVDLGERLSVLRDLGFTLAVLGTRPDQVRFLDHGGGWGEWAHAARGLGCQVALCELSPSRRAAASAAGIRVYPDATTSALPSARVDAATLMNAPSERFDLINSEQVLEHVGDPFGLLTSLHGLLADGGLLRVRVPNGRDIARRLRRRDFTAAKGSRWSMNLLAPLEHVTAFTPLGLRRLVARAGFAVVPAHIALRWQHGADSGPRHRRLRALLRPFAHAAGWTTDVLLVKSACAESARITPQTKLTA